MCLVVEYQKGVAYKIFYKTDSGKYYSPMNHRYNEFIQGYPLNKWITDKKQGQPIHIAKHSVPFYQTKTINNEPGLISKQGFFCFPSLQDAQAAYKLAGYMQGSNRVICRINYKKLITQGIDESSRPTLVVGMMKIVEELETLPF